MYLMLTKCEAIIRIANGIVSVGVYCKHYILSVPFKIVLKTQGEMS